MTETTTQACPACQAIWRDGQTCQDYFYQMLYWEAEDPANTVVHHLMVLCYHLQHPHLYSQDGLQFAQTLLVDFVEKGKTPFEVRQQIRDNVNSSNRSWKITARKDSAGAYDRPVRWKMTAADVVAEGIDRYCDSVRTWAHSVFESLKASGSLPAGG